MVPPFKESVLGLGCYRLIGDASPIEVFKRHPWSSCAKGIFVEIETKHLSVIRLISQSFRRGHRIAWLEDVGKVVSRFLLFRPLYWSFFGCLGLCDSVL